MSLSLRVLTVFGLGLAAVLTAQAAAPLGTLQLPATVQELCASVPGASASSGGAAAEQLVGPVQRLNTSTASWGYYRFGNTSSGRPPLLMLPGFGATLESFPLPMVEALAAEQEVIAVDQRGQGLTVDLRPLEPLTIQGLANETAEFVEALGLEQPPNMLGVSMGGMVAISLAVLQGDVLNKVIVAAGSAGGPETAVPPTDAALATLTSSNSTDVQLLSSQFPLDTPEGIQAACKYAITPRVPDSPSNVSTTTRQLQAVTAYLFFDNTIADALPSVENPVLLFAGLDDEVVPADNARAMAVALPQPWLVTFTGGHAAVIQHSSAFLQVTSAFLAD